MRDFIHLIGLGLFFLGLLIAAFTDAAVAGTSALTCMAVGVALAVVTHKPGVHGPGRGR